MDDNTGEPTLAQLKRLATVAMELPVVDSNFLWPMVLDAVGTLMEAINQAVLQEAYSPCAAADDSNPWAKAIDCIYLLRDVFTTARGGSTVLTPVEDMRPSGVHVDAFIQAVERFLGNQGDSGGASSD